MAFSCQMSTTHETSLRQRHSELTRDLILRTVAELLDEQPASELSVPEVARRSGVSLRTVYRYFPTREELIAATGEWIGVNVVGGRIPTALGDVPQVYAENAERWDERPRLVEAMALSRGANSLRSIRRQERLEKLREALREVTDGLPESEARQAFAVFAYLDNMLAWLTMRDEAGLDGKETGAAVAWAMNVLIDDLRRRQQAAGTSRKEPR
jgi:TetR/AcrR family transcriptional regulator, cholesterol catabolism regulator